MKSETISPFLLAAAMRENGYKLEKAKGTSGSLTFLDPDSKYTQPDEFPMWSDVKAFLETNEAGDRTRAVLEGRVYLIMTPHCDEVHVAVVNRDTNHIWLYGTTPEVFIGDMIPSPGKQYTDAKLIEKMARQYEEQAYGTGNRTYMAYYTAKMDSFMSGFGSKP